MPKNDVKLPKFVLSARIIFLVAVMFDIFSRYDIYMYIYIDKHLVPCIAYISTTLHPFSSFLCLSDGWMEGWSTGGEGGGVG